MVANGAISPQAPNLPPLRIRDHRIAQVSADASVGGLAVRAGDGPVHEELLGHGLQLSDPSARYPVYHV